MLSWGEFCPGEMVRNIQKDGRVMHSRTHGHFPRISSSRTTAIASLIALFLTVLAGCSGSMSSVQAAPTLQQQAAAGGLITLPAGTVNIDCTGQLFISKSTAIIGAGRDVTILHDTCPTGDTVSVNLTNPANVRLEELTIVHDGGDTVVHLVGGNHGEVEIIHRILRLSNVELSGATNCLVSDGLNQLFIEKSNLLGCAQDGAQIASFGVTLHDSWFGKNGRNGVTFTDGTAMDELGNQFSGFCASCAGNEFWLNKAHGLVYQVTHISDARHVGDYIDSNGDVGLVVSGTRDFTFNNGWIGSNTGGGAIIGDSVIGNVMTGNTFTNNFGPTLKATQTAGPLRLTGNSSSMNHDPCDGQINGGACFDLNTR